MPNHPKVEQCLSPVEKELRHLFTCNEVPGNRHRCVPVLLTADMKSAMDFLVDGQLRQLQASNLIIHTSLL